MTTRRIITGFLFLAVVFVGEEAIGGRPPLKDAPIVWYEDDRNTIEKPAACDPNVKLEYFESSWGRPRERTTDPVRITRRIGGLFGGDIVPPADNVNALDEIPNSTWFTNRIGLFPMTPEQTAKGPGEGAGPDRNEKWVIVSAKTAGVTPGFNIRDAKGDVYLIKFDPPGYLGQTSAAAVIANRFLYAAGYNVPDDAVVMFRRQDIVVGKDVMFTPPDGDERPMTDSDIDSILSRAGKTSADGWLAISSKFLDGEPVGPFCYRGRRKDDPNDRVNHENRRELRGLYVFAAWLNHFDTKRHNSLDMYVTKHGRSYLEHYLIDFASTLGAGAMGPNPRYGYEFTFDLPAILRRTFTIGLLEDRWRKRSLDHGFDEVGYFDSEFFRANRFRPTVPNDAFANTTDRDGYWGAKIVGAFSDAHIRAIVAEGKYRDAGASEYVSGVLIKNRDIIVRYFFDRVPPLDFFTVKNQTVHFHDLGERYGVYAGTKASYRVRFAAVDQNRSADKRSKTDWLDLEGTSLEIISGPARDALEASDAKSHPFLSMEFQVNRGDNWSPSVTAYMARKSGRIIAIDR